MSEFSQTLRAAVAAAEPRLRAISEAAACAAPSDPQAWSKKQELGHLVDSATNNRVRFIRAALDGEFAGPSYDGPGWVRMGGYATMPWAEIVTLWKSLNQALAIVVAAVPPERLPAQCRVGKGSAVTLEFLIDDYIRHMNHHLAHITAA